MSIDGVLQEQVGWYEAWLPLQERRNRGHFSTPPLLIEHILDACGYTPESDLRSIRVLDPACGSGNFLAASASRLLSSAIHANLPQQELIPLVQSNIWGFDPDPISCFLAEMHLSSTVTSTMGTISQPNLAHSPTWHIQQPGLTHPPTWHIHQADGLALPWKEPCIDLFLANPPYLASKNTNLSAYRSTHQRGQADSYLLFLNLGLQIVRPGGWLGLVLPDPLLARTNAANERARLLKEFTIHHLWHLAGVFTAQVGAVVIIAQKTPPQSHHQVAWKRERWQRTPPKRERWQPTPPKTECWQPTPPKT
jgi:type I restriction-modification system DNA methylase subunit